MPLLDDPPGVLDLELIAQRTAQLAKVSEDSLTNDSPKPWYVIGSEVPTPGGLQSNSEKIHITNIEDVKQTLEITKKAFSKLGLDYLWKRVVAIVVQPGVDFGDDFIVRYDRAKSFELSKFIEEEPLIYEAHSTDYQKKEDLAQMVEDHFAILKVGPALTYAFRDALFMMARIEDELIRENKRSNLVKVIDDVMVSDPKYWIDYYLGNSDEISKSRKNSYSDRIRYYWNYDEVARSMHTLFLNLKNKKIPNSIINYQKNKLSDQVNLDKKFNPQLIIENFINEVLFDYKYACRQNGS
jgi:D-tagatose-1,6-bisphosphate aldolase subunit GatZ/KbaZ